MYAQARDSVGMCVQVYVCVDEVWRVCVCMRSYSMCVQVYVCVDEVWRVCVSACVSTVCVCR